MPCITVRELKTELEEYEDNLPITILIKLKDGKCYDTEIHSVELGTNTFIGGGDECIMKCHSELFI